LCAFVFNRYTKNLNDLLKSPKGQQEIKKFDDLLKMTSYYTGLNITLFDFEDLNALHGTLEAESAMGLSLPE